ncbi:MAG: phosphoribosylamine--glycine ligase [bacterium]|nr:phosphoribosylamine--glycine ligase [bacterium]
MRVAVIGSGGREHALVWKLKQSPQVSELYVLPGNPGMVELAKLVKVEQSVAALVAEIENLAIDFVVVGPEQPLAEGLADELSKRGVLTFGPMKASAKLESSKVFAKRLMKSCKVPTAAFEVFSDFRLFEKFVQENPRANGRVVKADGLAAGKGAFVCTNDAEAVDVGRRLLAASELGEAGATIVVEEMLTGREASLHFLCDGERFLALPPAQDYKRAFDGDEGPNTGGMGTFCPARHVSEVTIRDVELRVVSPILKELKGQGTPYRGLLYVGIMLTESGPQVIEFNCRFGDPETQVMLPCLGYDLLEPMIECAKGQLNPAKYSAQAVGNAVCVVLCAEGYPASYLKHVPLTAPACNSNQILFSAGTTTVEGKWVSSGGRVLNAVGLGDTMNEARTNAYDLAHQAIVEGLRMRSDIALSEVS